MLKPSGVQVIRVISGDHELSALDFQKHYRLNIVHLLDTDRSFEKKYNKNGWPFLMVVNSEGQVVYTCNNMIDNNPLFKKELQKIKKIQSSPKTESVDGVNYVASTIEQNTIKADSPNERFARIAVYGEGKIAAVFTAASNGSSNVLLRNSDGKISSDIPVAATEADEYDADIATDSAGQLWICWTSNQKGKYNIFLASLSQIQSGASPIQISNADDDAMHGRLVCDKDNQIWVAYYKWKKMDNTSRDKEIYLRRYANTKLSQEIQLSPTDVPSYEDHTDPAISCLNNQAVVCWSWDYHKPKGYPQDCESPTIFARIINADLSLGNLFPLSGKTIESVPALSANVGKQTWCAWDSLEGTKKRLCIRAFSSTGAAGESIIIADQLNHLCSPSFAFYREQKGSLVWAQTADGQTWQLARSDYDFQKNSWGEKQILEDKQNPRFCSAVYDKDGALWIAYSAQTDKGREVFIKKY